MKNWHLPLLALLFSAMWFGIQPPRMVAAASDISNATFYGLVQITNNDTVSHVSTSNITNIYTSSMIAAGYIAANATNVVIRDSTNTDVAFQPGYGTNAWMTWNTGLAGTSSMLYSVYTGNVTGGTLRYFPESNGMNGGDHATMEIGSNFTLEAKGYVDTVYAANKSLVYKQDAFRIYNSANNTIKAAVLSAGDVEETVVTASGVASGEHTIAVYAQPGSFTGQALFGDKMVTNSIQSNATTYSPVIGATYTGSFGTLTPAEQVVASDGNLFNLSVVVSVAPGGADSYTWTLLLNGAPTALTASVVGAATTATDTTNVVAVTAGDLIAYEIVGSAGAAVSTGSAVIEYLPSTSGETIIAAVADAITNVATYTSPLLAGGWSKTVGVGMGKNDQIVPTSGTFKNLYLESIDGSSPGVGTSYVVTVLKNGVATPLTATLADAATTADDTTNSFTVAGNDTVVIQWAPVGAPGAIYPSAGLVFVPDVEGESILMSTIASPGGIGTTKYLPTSGSAEYNSATGTELLNRNLYTAGNMSNLYFQATATDAMTVRLRKNIANTALYATGSGYGADLVNEVAIVAGDLMAVYETMSFGSDSFKWSMVFKRPATASSVLSIAVDGVVADSATMLAGSVPDTANQWNWFWNNSMPYVEYQKIYVGGDLRQYSYWDYTAGTFQDHSGYGNFPTPTFSVDSSSAYVTGRLMTFDPYSPPIAPPFTINGTNAFLPVHNVTSSFSTSVTGTFPGADVIAAIASASGTPAQLPFTVIFGFFILAASITTTYAIRHYGSGSLLVKGLVIGVLMGAMTGVRVFDLWMVFAWVIMAITFAMASRHYSW